MEDYMRSWNTVRPEDKMAIEAYLYIDNRRFNINSRKYGLIHVWNWMDTMDILSSDIPETEDEGSNDHITPLKDDEVFVEMDDDVDSMQWYNWSKLCSDHAFDGGITKVWGYDLYKVRKDILTELA